MSVVVLKSDNELGYWEYSVRPEGGDDWNIEFSRADLAGPEHMDRGDLYNLHVHVTRNGEKFFNSWDYGDDIPFMTEHDMNGIIAAASVASLAFWYSASSKFHEIHDMQAVIKQALGDKVDAIVVGFDAETNEPISPSSEMYDPKYYLNKGDVERIGPFADATHALYMELHHYGMATTTSEWRISQFGKDEIEPTMWGSHEHE